MKHQPNSSVSVLVPLIAKRIITAGFMDIVTTQLPDIVQRLEAIDPAKPVIYPAGPLGFAGSTHDFLQEYLTRLETLGFPKTNILDPWQLTSEDELQRTQVDDLNERVRRLK